MCGDCRKIIEESAAYDCMICKNPPHLCRCKKVEGISEVFFAYFYSGETLKRAIYKMKRANLRHINEFFAKAMYGALQTGEAAKTGIDIVTNAPRMKNSVKFYGYNQAAALAKLISKYSGIPYISVLKASKSYETEQKTLNKTQRRQNVKNKFTAKPGGNLKDKNILIVDDVVTTGSTLSECAKIMKNMGADNVYALCAASVLS